MHRRLRPYAIGHLLFCALLAASPAAAQGNGKGNALGHNKRPSGSAATSSTAASGAADSSGSSFPSGLDGAGVRNFGSWLDDASVMTPGTGYASFAVGYWRMPGFTEVDVPSFDVGIALTRRVQVGASLPVYHAAEPGGPVARGLGDMYLSSKIQLREPAGGAHPRLGLAVIPVVEVLSTAPADGASRYKWGIPVAVELQRQGWRAYGSAGYFSRGSVFTSGAVEKSIADRVWLTGTISQSRSIKRDDLSEALGIPKVRTDISGGAAVPLSSTVVVFGMAGRTLSSTDPNRATLSLAGGLSVSFAAWQP